MEGNFGKTRVVALIDMDCFYCQVEQREKPELWGCPVAVVQYNQYQGGGIIALSYEARACGVRRGMRGEQAKELCPNLNICRVPLSKFAEKAELEKYRDASCEVFDVLCNFDERILVERASIDEAYIDLTALVEDLLKENDFAKKFLYSSSTLPTTHIANGMDKLEEGYDREANLKKWLSDECQRDLVQLQLAVGAEIVEIIREKIKERTQFHCSAGIGTNKILAKLVCSRHKPKEQTIITSDYVPKLFESTRITDVRGLGGKLGHQLMERYKIKFMSELKEVDRSDLQEHFAHAASFIELICQGIDDDPVRPRDKQLSIAASRNFPGKNALATVADVKCWLRKLVNDLSARLLADQAKNKRTAQSLSCGCRQDDHASRTTTLVSYDSESMFVSSWKLLETFNKSGDETWYDSKRKSPPVKNIYLSAHHFKNGVEKPSRNITEWLEVPKPLGKDNFKNDEEPVIADDDSIRDVSVLSDSSHSFIFEDEIDPSFPSTSEIHESLTDDLQLENSKKSDNLYATAPPARGGTGYGRQSNSDIKNENVLVGSSDLLPKSFESISKDVLESMPPEIKKELLEYYKQNRNVDSACSKRQNIASSSRRSPKSVPTSRIISRNTQRSSKSDTCRSKKISDFFKKT